MIQFFSRYRLVMAVLATAILLGGSVAEARMGGGRGFGSRGMRTWSKPPATQTIPNAQPIQRSVTPQGAQSGVGQTAMGQRNPAAAQPGGGLFGRGLAGGLMGGLLGAGLFGMLMGHGFFGGLAGLGSILGLVLQLALIFFLVRWAMRALARRSQPAMAGGPAALEGGGLQAGGAPLRRVDIPRAGGSPAPDFGRDTKVGQADLDQFERLLGEIQTAFGREDIAAIRSRATPEMLSYLTEELTGNAERGVINKVTEVKLLQGDVAESWREGGSEFATAAMRYSLTDVTEDRNTGAVVESGAAAASELWTFRRSAGGPWLLSAIQQG